ASAPPRYVCSQSMTVLCHRHELPGFSTQWPSSGKVRSFDGTPWTCSAVKSWRPWPKGTRKSFSLVMTSIGVFRFPPYVDGLHFRYRSEFHGQPLNSHVGNHSSSVSRFDAARSQLPSCETSVVNRWVWVAIQLIM